MSRRMVVGLSAAVILAATVAAPVGATKPDSEGFHKVWICHRTLSEVNPFVVIPVDIETWDEENNGHNRPHNNAPDDLGLGPVVKGQPKPPASACAPWE